MSDEFYQQLREDSRSRRFARQESNKELVQLLCGEMDIDVIQIAPHQLRLSKSGLRVDLFLIKNTFHNLNSNVRGNVKDYELFIENFFNV